MGLLWFYWCLIVTADILPRGYSFCNHEDCERKFKIVKRGRHTNYAYKARLCEDSDAENEDNQDSIYGGIAIGDRQVIPTSEAVLIGNMITTEDTAHSFTQLDLPTAPEVIRARTLQRQRLRDVKYLSTS